jgi:ribonuclease HII
MAMPWVVGIDEAGYGPNLGPFVQAAVALKLPEGDLAGWKALGLGRAGHTGLLPIDDSKKIYSSSGGLTNLARALPFPFRTIGELQNSLCLESDDLAEEFWYDPDFAVDCREQEIPGLGPIRLNVVPTKRFNRRIQEHGTKGAIVTQGTSELIQAMTAIVDSADELIFVCDKHGGRHFYGSMIQNTFPDHWPICVRESPEESRYRIEQNDRTITLIFQPKADSQCCAVAWASMVAKYVREICMQQFNQFWARHCPGLEPTAGYPVDAKRYFAAIRPAMAQLGLTDDAVWRRK